VRPFHSNILRTFKVFEILKVFYIHIWNLLREFSVSIPSGSKNNAMCNFFQVIGKKEFYAVCNFCHKDTKALDSHHWLWLRDVRLFFNAKVAKVFRKIRKEILATFAPSPRPLR